MSDLMLDVDQAGELKAAFRADLIREEKAPDVLADAQIQIGESAFWIGITKV